MKRTIYFIISAVILSSCINDNYNSLTFNGLKGAVKNVSSNCYYATERFGEIEKGKLIRESENWIPLYAGRKLEFDQKGNLIKETEIDDYGVISRVTKNEYKGNSQISMSIYDDDGELFLSWKVIFENDKPKTIQRFSKSDEDNNETIDCVFDGLRLVCEKHYQDGSLTEKTEFEYQNNLVSKSITTDKDDNVTFQMEQEYTKCGQLSFLHYIFKGENALEEHIEYNENNLPIQCSLIGEWSHGDVTYTFNYTSFDKEGNWLTRAVYKDNQLYIVEERTIDYY